jgi:hypothetical protein
MTRTGEPIPERYGRAHTPKGGLGLPLVDDCGKKGACEALTSQAGNFGQKGTPSVSDHTTAEIFCKVEPSQDPLRYAILKQAASLIPRDEALAATFETIARLGHLPVELGPAGDGKIKKPSFGKDWGLQTIEVRRKSFFNRVIEARRNGTLDSVGIGVQPRGRLLVIDVDPPDKDRGRLDETLDHMTEKFGGECPDTFRVDGEGGCHLYFEISDNLYDQWIKAGKSKAEISFGGKGRGNKIELFMPVEGSQHQVAVAPSTGKTITNAIDPAPLPEPFETLLIELFCRQEKKSAPAAPFQGTADPSWQSRRKCFNAILNQNIAAIQAASVGDRHITMIRRSKIVAGYAAGMGYLELSDECRQSLVNAALATGKQLGEAERVIEFGWLQGVKEPLIPSDPKYLKIEKDFADRATKLANSQAEFKSRIAEAVTKNANGETEFFEGRKPDHRTDPNGSDYPALGLIEMIDQDSTAAYRHLVEGYLESSQGMLVGMMGAGKGCFGPMLARHITNGIDWWTGRQCKPGSVVIISPEDSPETIKQRCRFAGARVHGDTIDGVAVREGPRVLCMGSGTKPITKPNGDSRSIDETAFFDTLREATGDLRLIVIDPVKSFMGKRGPSESEEDHVRRVLTISLNWANKNCVAILLIIHPSKGSGVRNVNEQASGSHAWTAVTRSVVAIEKNINYGPSARALIAGRQSNAQEGLTVLFDLEVGDARDRFGERVPVTDEDGIVELTPDGTARFVSTVRLTYRESLPADHEYELPPFDRESTSKAKALKSVGRKVVDLTAIRLAACQLVAAQPGGRMTSFPDDELLKQMGSVETDDRWLHFACGHLARQFSCSPTTALNKVRSVFRRKDREPVSGYTTSLEKVGFGDTGQWLWTSRSDPSQIAPDGVDF